MSDEYTKIPNQLMDILRSDALSRNEIRVLLHISRKTYGFHKKSDRISISQFQEALNLSRQGVVSILKRLELVKLCILVNKGNSRLASSEWKIDTTDYTEKLVKLSGLVKFTPNKLVNIRRLTKESITKESSVSDKLAFLLGDRYKFENNKHLRIVKNHWEEIKSPSAYLKKVEENQAAESQEKGGDWINAKDYLANK